jgi:competence protein ComFA
MPEQMTSNKNTHSPKLLNTELQSFLSGRQLLLEDIPFPLEEIHDQLQSGFISFRKGMEVLQGKPICNRCGNAKKELIARFPCSRCNNGCYYCRNCIMMGRVSSCTSLVTWIGPAVETQNGPIPLDWTGSLSEGQRLASDRVVNAVVSNEDLLVWAVCGAGKTEVLFAGIERALQLGKRVCLATPRTDVVLELSPRLRKVFPQTPISTLYGGSEERHQYGSLTIATTHQLLRFYKAFDMMIVDEVDAFPYTADDSLQFAVQQARKTHSSLIFLTATPNQTLQQQCRNGKRNYVTIPARFHRHPLPVPKFIWCGDWKKRLQKTRLPANVLRWANLRIKSDKQALIFFPNIRLMEKALPVFKKIDSRIEAVHAEDCYRKDKVQKMRNREIPILLTTTILERGVTFPNIDVAVVGAEEDIFTESALVQIAGRVGRSAKYPFGHIDFFHYGISASMQKARIQIKEMNQQARNKGLID